MFVYEISGCGFDSRCSHLTGIFRYRPCLGQVVPWHSGKVWIHSKKFVRDMIMTYCTLRFMESVHYRTELKKWPCTSSPSEVILRKSVPKVCCKFTGQHPCRRMILIKLQSNAIEVSLWHGCSPVNLLHIFRTTFPKNISGWLLLSLSNFEGAVTCCLNWSSDISNLPKRFLCNCQIYTLITLRHFVKKTEHYNIKYVNCCITLLIFWKNKSHLLQSYFAIWS